MINIKNFKKHSLRENFNNVYLSTCAFFKYLLRIPSMVSPPIGYKRVFFDEFSDDLDPKKWRLGQQWGDFHPSFLNQYYDTDGELAYTTEEGLVLEIKNKPKEYIKSELPEWRRSDLLPDRFTIPVGIGKVSSIEGWQWGWFEAWVKVPRGKNYWLSYWMSGINSWPPEIDIFEAYSDNGKNYNSDILGLKNFKIQPNLHFGNVESGTKDHYGAYSVPVHGLTDRFIQYVCHWEKDFIRIYYDGQMVFETTNPDILKWYNGENDKMSIIFGHGHKGFDHPVDESNLIISQVKVYQRN
jgi:hypothetical protein